MMSFAARNYDSQGGTLYDDHCSSFSRHSFNTHRTRNMSNITHKNNNNSHCNNNYNYKHNWNYNHDFPGRLRDHFNDNNNYVNPPREAHSMKRRKLSAGAWGDAGRHFLQPVSCENAASAAYNNPVPFTSSNAETSTSTSCKRDRSKLEDDDPVFMSKDEIERHSPSRKDGIDALRETHLRYSYCAFLQNLGMRLDLPQTTVGTAMVLCHRFFVRRSHACHDRFLIATAALFLASKSEETPRPLNNVLRVSSEIFHKQDMTFLSYLLPVDWFEQYRERVIEAEQMILTTLNFELNVQHPYASLTSVLNKTGFSQNVLVNLALNLISEGEWCCCSDYPSCRLRRGLHKNSVHISWRVLNALHGIFFILLKLN
ncbi:cyclin-T1-4-like isoform X2 [Mercurialis annua]|uniref:cyclin-T1-4-like isoform X2 n=1 Tax=Mercurialis annua TaxID=3986 RepID=UPI0021605B20|nr:cyclin-T1-4-like isoform X2 [Mercurialis annua]